MPKTIQDKPNYLIRARLCGVTNPLITGLLFLPPCLAFDKVHEVPHIAFGWTSRHLHSFTITLTTDERINPLGAAPPLSLYPDPKQLT